MKKKRHLTAVAGVLVLVFSGLFAYNAYRMYDAIRFNASVRDGTFDQPGGDDSVHGLFVKGYVHQQRGEFEQALKTYARIERSEDVAFRNAVNYNMANLYLQKASAAEQRGDHDLVIPLVALAKQMYRELLRENSNDWQAKYNLERALQLLPDIDQQETSEDVMPERSPRALGVVEVYEQLP